MKRRRRSSSRKSKRCNNTNNNVNRLVKVQKPLWIACVRSSTSKKKRDAKRANEEKSKKRNDR